MPQAFPPPIPQGDFKTPSQIAEHPGLTNDQKMELLGKWKYDLERQLESESEGMSASDPIGARTGGDLSEQLRLLTNAMNSVEDNSSWADADAS
jgi:hypothetical protein